MEQCVFDASYQTETCFLHILAFTDRTRHSTGKKSSKETVRFEMDSCLCINTHTRTRARRRHDDNDNDEGDLLQYQHSQLRKIRNRIYK